MIAQNDRNKILINFLLLHFLPGELEKLENGKNVIFYPKNDQKIENFRKIFEIFFGRNRFRMVQNVFQNENIDFENFSR